ncbi:MAG TPA: ubiquinol-cytochrome c reductase cytochrome b subunit [Candidatus Limnocylindrales bacterium]
MRERLTRQPADAGLVPEPTEGGEERTELERLVGWLDERTGAAAIARGALRKVFPDHWSFLLGEVALFCLVILVATGTFLTFFFTPDTTQVTYQGPYAPLDGQQVSAAFASVMRLSFEVRAGLLMRQVHHWTALIFVGSIVLHLCRIFFTGAFRRPREINWLVGFGLLLMAMGEGFTGYSLPDDLLSGTGLRIAYSVAMSIPFIGPYFAFLIFGGEFPAPAFLSRLFVFHIMLLPALLIGAVSIHLLIIWIQKHTQYPGPGRTEDNVVGAHLWPGQAFRSIGLLFLTGAVVTLIAGFVQINPVWAYGPFIPYTVSSPAQPDWYIGWLEGALRIGPNFEPHILGITIPSPFWPGVLVPGILFTVLIFWPFIEAAVRHDHRQHDLLDLPWQAPVRTAIGAALLTVFAVLTLAGANDILAVFLSVRVESLTEAFRVLVVVAPIVVGLVTYRLCIERRDRGASVSPPAGTLLRRTPDGGFEEVEA